MLTIAVLRSAENVRNHVILGRGCRSRRRGGRSVGRAEDVAASAARWLQDPAEIDGKMNITKLVKEKH